ncbi:MAG: hypothetical protein AMXMBFR64_25380 [Myxococcales bacterium]
MYAPVLRWLTAALTLAATVALAQSPEDQLGLGIRSSVQQGEQPALLFAPTVDLKRIGVTLRRPRDQKVVVLESGPVRRGATVELPWTQPDGAHAYEAHIEATPAGGAALVLDIAFECATVPPLAITIDKAGVDLDARTLRFKATRPVTRAVVKVLGDTELLGEADVDLGTVPTGRAASVTWTQRPGTIRRIELTAHDDKGFWSSVEVRSVYVEPWEDRIYFAFGSDAVEDREKPKLDATLRRIEEALATARREVGDSLDLRLYVAGYTDTVGTPQSNQDLSERRARSIGGYLRSKGLSIPVYYQGFGESVLAVKTGDEVENERNRRTVYVLSSQTPMSELFPRTAWRKL